MRWVLLSDPLILPLLRQGADGGRGGRGSHLHDFPAAAGGARRRRWKLLKLLF